MPHEDDFAGRKSGWFGWLGEAFRNWRERIAQQREIAALEQRGELDRVLADVGLSPDQLSTAVHAHPGSLQRRTRMMKWLGVDPARLPNSYEKRDIEWRCIQCDSVRECKDWLAAPPRDSAASPHFCPNVTAFERIRAWQIAAPAGRPRGGIMDEIDTGRGR
jgi:uncharacterized protein YjiS (DUF1127 family)